jgi:hypothetical protein
MIMSLYFLNPKTNRLNGGIFILIMDKVYILKEQYMLHKGSIINYVNNREDNTCLLINLDAASNYQ